MRGRHGPVAIIALAVATVPTTASAQGAVSISLPSQPLASTLRALAQRFGLELLFSQEVVAGRSAPAVTGRMRGEKALEIALAGSGLTVRRVADGSYLVVRSEPVETNGVEAVPEILVVGRRTQNADIRRTEDDVRPYQVVTRREIATSHVATVEELASKRLTANAQGSTLAQQGAGAMGETASSIDFRGMGTSETLVLIDGRRLPQMPGLTAGLTQSDVNALPPEAIERVEAITATAGGVYGPGATAGVVNLILQRDYRGIDANVTHGVTSRGDAPYRRISVRMGFTPDHGATDVMLQLSRSDFAGLETGDRDYAYRASARRFANDPVYAAQVGFPPSDSLNVVSGDGTALTFKPAYGGGALASAYTHVSPADGRSTSGLVQQLSANAGVLDLVPGANVAGGGSTLLSSRRTSSIIGGVRHRSGAVQLFVDYLRFTNRGEATNAFSLGGLTLTASNPGNPFEQAITIYGSDPVLPMRYDFRTLVSRATGGLIVDLPASWHAEADFSLGTSQRRMDNEGEFFNRDGFTGYYSQVLLGRDIRNPLADYSTYLASFDGAYAPTRDYFEQTNRFSDASLRLAGPVTKLGGGDLTVTFLAERRRERVSGGTSDASFPLVEPTGPIPLARYGQTASSLYAELRAPVFDRQTGPSLLRGLELQLAIRHDRLATSTSLDTASESGGGTRVVHNAGLVYVAGFKVSPSRGVLIRGSLSTGEQPLTVAELSRRVFSLSLVVDPKRGNRIESYSIDQIVGGPPNPRAALARSLSVGAVIEPGSISGLRLSLDYTHISKRRETIPTSATGIDYFLTNEDVLPGRVTRMPLTAQDAALGYTAGRIVQLDTSSLQTGRTSIDSIDGLLDLRIPSGKDAVTDVHAGATWQPHFIRKQGFGLPSRDYRNAIDGAVSIRGNAGIRWSRGPLAISTDWQFTGSYRLNSAVEYLVLPNDVRLQGGSRIPGQFTTDIGAEYRFNLPPTGASGRARTLELRFGIQDVLDRRAATMINAPGGYSIYADPRRRRFELAVTAAL